MEEHQCWMECDCIDMTQHELRVDNSKLTERVAQLEYAIKNAIGWLDNTVEGYRPSDVHHARLVLEGTRK